MAAAGTLVGIVAFALVILSASFESTTTFRIGVLLVGFGGGLFGHGTLTATMNSAPREHTGLALGAWGAVQATGAGVAVATGGVLSDVFGALAARGQFGPALGGPNSGYVFVYGLEIAMLAATTVLMGRLIRKKAGTLAPA